MTMTYQVRRHHNSLLKNKNKDYKEVLQTLIVILCISSISYLVALLKMAM